MSLRHRLEVAAGRAYVVGGVLLRMALRGSRLKTVRTQSGLKFPYVRAGTGRRGTIVWLHGFADHPATFLPVAERLANDYEVIAPAMPGFAGPRPKGAQYSIESYTAWTGEFLDALGLADVHLAGNSLGGAAALGFALSRPKAVASLTLVDTAGVHRDDVPSLAHEVARGDNLFDVRNRSDYDHFVDRVYHRPPKQPWFVDTFLYDEMRRRADWYCKIMGDIQGDAVDPTQDHPGWLHHHLRSVRVPTQVVWGDRDSFFPLPLGEFTAAEIPGATLHVLPQTGHCPHAEQPQALAELLASFAATTREPAPCPA